jgi:hypothetical protein
MESRGEELQQQYFVILAQERPMHSFTLCNILPLTLQIDQRAGPAPEPVWTQWWENASLPPLGIEPLIPNRPVCCVVTILRCPLLRSTCQADFSSRKAGFASRTVRVGFAGKKSEWDTLFCELFCPSSVAIPQKLLRHSSITRRKEKWPATCHSSSEKRKEKLWPQNVWQDVKICCNFTASILYRSVATELATDNIIEDSLEIKQTVRQF